MESLQELLSWIDVSLGHDESREILSRGITIAVSRLLYILARRRQTNNIELDCNNDVAGHLKLFKEAVDAFDPYRALLNRLWPSLLASRKLIEKGFVAAEDLHGDVESEISRVQLMVGLHMFLARDEIDNIKQQFSWLNLVTVTNQEGKVEGIIPAFLSSLEFLQGLFNQYLEREGSESSLKIFEGDWNDIPTGDAYLSYPNLPQRVYHARLLVNKILTALKANVPFLVSANTVSTFGADFEDSVKQFMLEAIEIIGKVDPKKLPNLLSKNR